MQMKLRIGNLAEINLAESIVVVISRVHDLADIADVVDVIAGQHNAQLICRIFNDRLFKCLFRIDVPAGDQVIKTWKIFATMSSDELKNISHDQRIPFCGCHSDNY